MPATKDNKQEVKIMVLGDPGSGKSAIAQRISNILTDHGFEVGMKGSVTVRDLERLENALRHLSPVTRVTIIEREPQAPVSRPSAAFDLQSGIEAIDGVRGE